MIHFKCLLCGKPESVHNAITKACPVGTKHRSVGFTSYHNVNRFTPNYNKPIKKSEFTL